MLRTKLYTFPRCRCSSAVLFCQAAKKKLAALEKKEEEEAITARAAIMQENLESWFAKPKQDHEERDDGAAKAEEKKAKNKERKKNKDPAEGAANEGMGDLFAAMLAKRGEGSEGGPEGESDDSDDSEEDVEMSEEARAAREAARREAGETVLDQIFGTVINSRKGRKSSGPEDAEESGAMVSQVIGTMPHEKKRGGLFGGWGRKGVGPPGDPPQLAQEVQLKVPPNAAPGTILQFYLPDGRTVQIAVPPGTKPGQVLTVRVPEEKHLPPPPPPHPDDVEESKAGEGSPRRKSVFAAAAAARHWRSQGRRQERQAEAAGGDLPPGAFEESKAGEARFSAPKEGLERIPSESSLSSPEVSTPGDADSPRRKMFGGAALAAHKWRARTAKAGGEGGDEGGGGAPLTPPPTGRTRPPPGRG